MKRLTKDQLLNGDALLFEDYLKVRDCKVGDTIELSDGIVIRIISPSVKTYEEKDVKRNVDILGTYVPYGSNDTADNR